MFMTSSLDPRIESVMPILSKLRRAVSENKIPQVEELAEWADSIIEGNLSNDAEDIIDSDDLSEAPEEKIADRYDPEDFDAMVSRVGQKAKEQQRKNPVDIADLARRMHGVLSKDRDVKTDEGLVGAALGGAAGAMLTKTPQGALSGANLGSEVQDALGESKKDFAASLKKNIEKSNQKKKETDKKVEQHQSGKKGINEVDMGQADSTLRGGHKQSTDKMGQIPALHKAAKKMGYEHYMDVPDDKVSELKALAGKFRSGSAVNEGQRDLDTIKRLLGK
jgi:flagellar hook-basal body complex protein FliE